MGLANPLAQKGAIGPCEANVGLSRNLVVVLLSDRLQLVLHIRRAATSRSEKLDLDGAFDLPV